MTKERIAELRAIAQDRFDNDIGEPDDNELNEALDEIEKLRAVVEMCRSKFHEYCGRNLLDLETEEPLMGNRDMANMCKAALNE